MLAFLFKLLYNNFAIGEIISICICFLMKKTIV